MKRLIGSILICFYVPTLIAQHPPKLISKPPIDTADLLRWPIILDGSNPIISNNGEYMSYRVSRISPEGPSVIIRSVNGNWETSLTKVSQVTFTSDSRRAIFLAPGDKLCILTLPNIDCEYQENVHSFKLFMQKGREMLIYHRSNQKKELVLYELTLGIKHIYSNIDSHTISKDSKNMLLLTTPDSVGYVTLLWVDLETMVQKPIWKGNNATNLCFDESGKQLAFLVYDTTNHDNSLWLYKLGQTKALEILRAGTSNLSNKTNIVSIENFNSDGEKLFLQISEKSFQNQKHSKLTATVWSYRDPKLQTQQIEERRSAPTSYLAVLDIRFPNQIWRIQYQDEYIAANNGNGLIVLTSMKGNLFERHWSSAAVCNSFLIRANEKERRPFPLNHVTFSPNQKYLLGHHITDTWAGDLYIYELSTNTTRNITKKIPAATRLEEDDMTTMRRNRGLMLARWLPEDTAVLIYDYYDIWLVDLTGKRKATKLTNGSENKIQFRLAGEDTRKSNVIQPDVPTILTAFNTKNKQHGFYQLKWNTVHQPELLFMGDYFFSRTTSNSHFLKARDRNIYIVRREQTGKSPNLFTTTDFRTFAPLSLNYPEKTVNWFTSELVTFTTTNGIETQAILYKPENFNPTNKYPLLIHYYDKKSDELNRYRLPQSWGTGADLDIAWFASHGYLVLLTDIHFSIGKPGKSIEDAILGAAKHITRRSYIDKDHIGIQGHSFGGYETMYLITHSNFFAAAVTSAGVSDAATSYNSLWPDGSSVQEYFETTAYRIDSTPWQAPSSYTANSPIFSVASVKTPVLMVHNKKDKNVWFEQGLEFFTALRRAGKRAWLLQYDNGSHGQLAEDYKDYLIRTTQFFDHYLRGNPPPNWMTNGNPAWIKGISDGLELDKATKILRRNISLIDKEQQCIRK